MRISDLPILDYDDPAFRADPFVWLAEKAKVSKVARSERGVEILDYELCRAFLLDQALGTDHGNLVERMGLPESRALDFKRRMLLTQNRGQTRQRLRRALSGLIGPKYAKAMRADIAAVVSDLLDGLRAGEVDLKRDFAELVPAGVYCSWVKAPLSDARFVADMSETVLSIFRRDPNLTPTIVAAYDELFGYACARLDERRRDRGNDFLSALIRIEQEGDLSTDELEDFAVMLIEASTDNTSHQIAIAVDRLVAMPEVWSAIAKDPNLATPAVREVMRLWPRSLSTSRTALENTEIDGVEISKGTSVFASFGACHRQADMFDDPHRFRLDRRPSPPHMNFGGGAFSCLGQYVAVIEGEEAIAQLAKRHPTLRVVRAERDFTAMFQSLSALVGI